MNTLIHADVFFFVATIALVVVSIFFIVFLVYLIQVAKRIRDLTINIQEKTTRAGKAAKRIVSLLMHIFG